MILAAGAMLFSNILGRSASIAESGLGAFNAIREGKCGDWKNLFQGITGGPDDNVIGCLSELAVDVATLAIPTTLLPLQIGLNLFRGASEYLLGGDSLDACMYLVQGVSGGDFKGTASQLVKEGKDIHEVWKGSKGTKETSRRILDHAGGRIGHLAGRISKQASPSLKIFFEAAKKTYNLVA